MGRARNWSTEELLLLEELWGVLSIKAIAKRMNRSVNAVKIKAGRIGLGDNRLYLDGITLSQLSNALNTAYCILKNWVNKHEFPAKSRVLALSRPCLVVGYDDFWNWAEQHKHLINFAKLEPNLLGPEPDWAKDKRKLDIANYNKIPERPWSEAEDMKLRSMVNAHRYTYPEIAKVLKRTEFAVKRRLYDLRIKARPVRLNNHVKYTDEEIKLLVEMLDLGYGYNTMAERLGKSALGIKGKLERMGYKFKGQKVMKA